MKIIKYLISFVIVIALLFVFIVNFSAVSSNYECSGKIKIDETSYPITVYTAIEEYRWWVGLWSDSDGNVRLEIPNKLNEYYSRTEEIGTNVFIYYEKNDLKGNFSKLSKILALKSSYGFFDGKCKAIN